jgi:hypothetical protein
VASVLALVLSVFSLYLQRKDRRPRLEIRTRYEYRTAPLDGTSPDEPDPPAIHDRSQEGLYLLLGDFLREYDLEYPRASNRSTSTAFVLSSCAPAACVAGS